MMKTLIVIPARYASSRFPGKPLAMIAGKSLLLRVWQQCAPVLGPKHVVVATESEKIRAHCEENGMRCVMTSDNCPTGTDRLAEVAHTLEADLYINVQGDEPLIDPDDIRQVINAAHDRPDTILNAYCPIEQEADYYSETVPKVVFRPCGRLLYMSRAPIPGNKQGSFSRGWKQVCIYAFPPVALHAYAAQGKQGQLENEEDIEILRFLELGYEVEMIPVSRSSIAVDVPEDVTRVEQVLNQAND